MNDTFVCQKCGYLCTIDGEYPKFDAWCDTCKNYAEGFDCLEYAAEHLGNKIDYIYDMMKNK